MNLAGRKALVLGGTSGIGLAAARRLAEAGAQVVALSRRPEKADDELPKFVQLERVDVLGPRRPRGAVRPPCAL